MHHRCPGDGGPLRSSTESHHNTKPHLPHEEKGREESRPPLIRAQDVPPYGGGLSAPLLSREVGGLYHCSREAGGARRPFPAARAKVEGGFKWGLQRITGGWRLSGCRIAKRKKGICRKLFYAISWIYVSYNKEKASTESLKHRNPCLGN